MACWEREGGRTETNGGSPHSPAHWNPQGSRDQDTHRQGRDLTLVRPLSQPNCQVDLLLCLAGNELLFIEPLLYARCHWKHWRCINPQPPNEEVLWSGPLHKRGSNQGLSHLPRGHPRRTMERQSLNLASDRTRGRNHRVIFTYLTLQFYPQI